MNRHKMFSSQMGTSKYEFGGDLDSDIKRKMLEADKRKKEIRDEVFKVYQSYGREYAEKELRDLVVGILSKEIIVTPKGFKEIERSQNGT